MPAKLRSLTGADVVQILAHFGFENVSQRGSHVKLRRLGANGSRQTLHLPLHKEVRKGTLRAIYVQALRYIPEDELRPHFYLP